MDRIKKKALWRFGKTGFLSLLPKLIFSVNIDLLRREQRFLLGGLNGAEKISMVGMMLQHDTSEHDWLEGRGPENKLIASIDDANNEVHC
ncbi:MAG: hypothetical protein FJ242_03215 [Nitrospira sp.]|nr:hypothetical protein [Nitrospira sp.]